MDVTVEQGTRMNKTFLTLDKLETKNEQAKKSLFLTSNSYKESLRASFRDKLLTWRGPGLQQARTCGMTQQCQEKDG